jgi:hypothetical protein
VEWQLDLCGSTTAASSGDDLRAHCEHPTCGLAHAVRMHGHIRWLIVPGWVRHGRRIYVYWPSRRAVSVWPGRSMARQPDLCGNRGQVEVAMRQPAQAHAWWMEPK